MKNLIKSTLLLLVLLLPATATAHDFEVDGIYYNINGNEATVTYEDYNSNCYSGDITIPESVTYDGSTYTVTAIGYNAFKNCTGLTSIDIPNSVTTIGNYAFSRCSRLTSINIPNSVSRIGFSAFSNCSGLTSIEIPNSVTSTGYSAFSGCTGLTSISIPNSVTTIDDGAFGGCSGLTSINIPNSVATIGDEAFSNCSSLTSIIVPNSVSSIGYNAFDGTAWFNNQPDGLVYAGLVAYTYKGYSPNSITLKEGTKGIADHAFAFFTRLTSITIPTSVTSIGYDAFLGCDGLTSVYISDIEAWCKIKFGNNPLYYAHHLFLNGEEVTNLIIPNTVTSISGSAFGGCYGLTSVEIPNSVTVIGGSAFSECYGLTSIEIPNSVTVIGGYAFNWCTGLNSVEIPNTVTSIGTGAFQECSGLTSIEIPNSVNSIEDYTFYGCSSLTSIDIPNSITSIGDEAFRECNGLTRIDIPNSVTSIGDYAFYNCSNLDNVTIGNSVTFVGKNAFGGSTPWPNNMPDGVVYIGLIAYKYNGNMPAGTSISLREGTTSIAASAFQGCSGLVGINIPNSVTSIGNYAFQNCSGLTSVTIPDSVTSIGESAFSGCTGLTNLTLPNSETSFGYYVFSGCSSLTNVNFGNSLTYIGWGMFSGCSGLTSVTIPNSVTSIGFDAFSDCSGLTSINIPNSVTAIGGYAFTGCSGLTRVNITDLAAWCRIDFDSYDGGANPLSYAHHLYLNGSEVTDLEIPGSVTRISSDAFKGCNGLTSVTIPNSVTSIGDYTFYGCTGLTSVNISNSVKTIGNGAFSGCTALDTLNFNAESCEDFSSTTNYQPFYNLNISTINIGDSVQRIPSYFANGLTALTNLTIGKSVTNCGYNAFTNCTGIKQLTWNAINCSSNGGMPTANIEQVIIGDHVQTIPQYFVRNSKISEVTIPNSVTYIGSYAFQNCSGLICVTLPSSVTDIDYNAFYGCSNLTRVDITDIAAWCSINFGSSSANPLYYAHHLYLNNNEIINLQIPDPVTNIGYCAFINCSELTNVSIPNSVTNIGSNAFYGCNSIKQLTWDAISCSYNGDMPTADIEVVTIGNEVQVIPYNFVNGSKITEVNIPNSVTNIGNYAFNGCTGLTGELTIPNSVTTIGNSAFYGCIGLASLTIGQSVTEIGNSAFYNCSGLIGELTIPNSVTTISYNAFNGCTGLANLTIGQSVTNIDNLAFYGCTGLTGELTIPNSVTNIGSSAFQGCTGIETLNYNAINCADFGSSSYQPFYNLNITSINIGDNVHRIPAYFAYGLSKLSSVTMPSSVTSVGTQAFYNCPIIESVTCLATTPPSTSTNGIDMFNTNVYIHSPLYVPMGTEKSYMYDQSWGQFINVIGIKVQDDVLATEITLDQSVMSMILGTTSQLVATVMPDSTTNKAVSWASSNPSVATVDENGLVTAMGLGSATITAVTCDGSNLSASCRVIVTSLSATNMFVINDAEVQHGQSITIPIAMNNEETIMAFQTDIYLPKGFNIVTNQVMEPIVTPGPRLTEDHQLVAEQLNWAVRVLCYTPDMRPIVGNEGDLFYITVMVPENAEGNYTIYLRDSRLTTANYEELRIPDAGAVITVKDYIPGDANDSHTVTVTDIVVTAQYILQRNPSPFIFAAADMNDDGSITVTDIMLIARLILYPEEMNAPRHAPVITTNNDCMSGEDIALMAGETRRVSILLDNEMDYSAFQLDLALPDGLTASNFALTDRAGRHAFDVSTIDGGKLRALCYSPAIEAIEGHSGALLTFDVTATAAIEGNITVDGIELVTTDCQTVLLDGFTIGVNNVTSVNELSGGKTVARIDYYNLAGQRIDRPESGVTLVVTTYTDGTRTTAKVIQ